MRVIANPFFETGEQLKAPISIASYFTSQKYAEENPDVVERFVRALNKGTQYAADNPDAVRKAVQDYAKLPAAVAEKMTLPFFSTDLSEETFPFLAERMEKYGMVPKAPDVKDLVPEGAGS
jgi:NitT/TauT family transport system substrate-binding protein